MSEHGSDDGRWILGLVLTILFIGPLYLGAALVGVVVGVWLTGPGLQNIIPMGIAVYAFHKWFDKW